MMKKEVKKKSEMERKRDVRLTENSNTAFHACRTKKTDRNLFRVRIQHVCNKIGTMKEQQLEEIENRVGEKCVYGVGDEITKILPRLCALNVSF